MYQAIIYQELDNTMQTLERLTLAWFASHKDQQQADLFYRYMNQSQSGCFKQHYARVLDSSMESLTSVLPQLTNRLAPGVAETISTSALKTRRIFSLIIYWLIQYHSGHARDLPEREEMLDIFSSILESTTLKMW
ncbi:hypothetical protein KXR87_21365 [Yokenella regensburgei]|uniref:hypothetical protein n=1 Tax=Yokenella regensburgei TaxID=158877 RepID=UPI003F156C45